MLYQRKSFQVPATNGNPTLCESSGHSMPDTKGKCIRCGGYTNTADALCAMVTEALLPIPVRRTCDPAPFDGQGIA